jgi:hypothetical protein
VPVAIFRLSVPVLVSLVAIRLTVRVLRAPSLVECDPRHRRTVSWLAWLGVVLWITGAPRGDEQLDAITELQDDQISARNVLEGTLSAIAGSSR